MQQLLTKESKFINEHSFGMEDDMEQGNMKNNIILKNEEFLNDILSNNIEKIIFSNKVV